MKSKIFIAVFSLLLFGCTTTAAIKNPEETNYVQVSSYRASLIYQIFTGGAKGCKLSSHNMILGESTILMDENGNCTVEVESVSD